MARRKIREFDVKRIIAENIPAYGEVVLNFNSLLVDTHTDLETLPEEHPWLLHRKLTVKPDQLFGKRKQYGLILLNATYLEIKRWIIQHQHKETTIGKATDTLTHFLIEPFIPHDEEYYLAFTSERDGDHIHFSAEGGMDIEQRWHSVKSMFIPTLGTIEGGLLEEEIPADIPEEKRKIIIQFITALFHLYRDFDFAYLELNPFTIDQAGAVHLLDAVAEMDNCASWKNEKSWDNLAFPTPFGRKESPEEEYIFQIDEQSGASLKLTILNPNGRIWNILSGGGASIIYLDTMVNSGYGTEISNYGEYSGNPTTEESYQYAKTILGLMTRKPHPQGKMLIIGGAIANFTDIEKTFLGICKALEEYQEELRKGNILIYVRRGGPNYEKGLSLMKETGKKINNPIKVFGPDMPMVDIIPLALEGLQ